MVFRGKPSKACERCRERRLKCDLRPNSCGQCIRARAPCAGYRDTHQLRIRDESQNTIMKFSGIDRGAKPQYLPLSIDLQARDAFFTYYVTSKCWDFLEPYSHPSDCPEHLALAIEAVSLAYLWHQVDSSAALATARQRYVSALHLTKKALASPGAALEDATFVAPLLLDLFEKITNSESKNSDSWRSHIDGALALVKLRGCDEFLGRPRFQMLCRLSNHCTISCIASHVAVPPLVDQIQDYVGTYLGIDHPMQVLSELLIEYAHLRSTLQSESISCQTRIDMCMELRTRIYTFELGLPPYWHYLTTRTCGDTDRIFGSSYDTYGNPRVCQARNILRVISIILGQSIVRNAIQLSPSGHHSACIASALETISTAAHEICASSAQYLDCIDVAWDRLPTSTAEVHSAFSKINHAHTHSHQMDCYTLIFPLYIAGTCNSVPGVKQWILAQIRYITHHFHVRNAQLVAHILEQDIIIDPWQVYTMLGGYAFAA